jgi:stage V sporulation protein G
MEITEVRVKLVENKDERLKAFCSMTLDNEFVIRDIKIIEGTNGLFVAMPSRKMSDHCERCGGKNHLRARYCNNCGSQLPEERAKQDVKGRMKLHADIAHPINADCRKRIQDKIAVAFEAEVERSKEPGYKPVDLDEPEDMDVPD